MDTMGEGTLWLIREYSKQSTRRTKASSSSACALQPQDDNNKKEEVDEIQEDPEDDTQQVPSPASSSKENSNNNNHTTPATTTEEATTSQQATNDSTNGADKPAVGSAEWHRIRRENHKQVERRRRETINEGINEIARMVPGCEKNKGQILHRAALYIQQLKESESTTLEKWTLEKLLTDQAMNELNRQVDGLKSELEQARQEIDHLKRQLGDKGATNPPSKRARLTKEEKE
ncbi:hypothetical protein K492DRAFT_175364 [Lichtheimia hyalospora FSU 10163]|nr:hypothetical protein K492DRAFT_175364 [Lichtheimia hyalospora FSU 10163]